MTQALFTSQTGLKAGTEQLTVVSDNVANMNTTAYKTSRVDFQDIWYSTRTTGTNSSLVTGGTNPYQIGVGVRCASITKDFTPSSTNTTGRADDMAITGSGWFTVLNSDGHVLLTRDGTFSLDEEGYLCTADGCKVLGMDQVESVNGSTIPVRIPQSIKVVEYGTSKTKLGNMFSTDLNGLKGGGGITDGDFTIYLVKNDGTETPITVNLEHTENLNMNAIVHQINIAARKADAIDDNGIRAKIVDGAIQFTIGEQSNAASLRFESGTSNFVSQCQLAGAPKLTTDTGTAYYSTATLDYTAEIGAVDDVTSENTKQYKSYSVGKDGLITVTYGDGSTLSVRANDDGTTYFSYTDANSIIINDDVQNSGNASLTIDPNVLVKANMQLQMAKVVNDGGLVAEGNNRYSVGVNAGDVLFTTANINGVGGVITGALESSNVDLAQQFSNMILAQRLVQANSQVFSGANSMLETLVYLGR